MKAKLFLIAFLHMTFVCSTQAQANKTITGKVTEPGGKTPLPGVTVQVKGTTIGTATDTNGNYAITVPAEKKLLVFSFIGFKTQEKIIGENTIIDVVLQLDGNALQEVVVVGYATQQKKIDITGAVAGVNISKGKGMKIQIRGTASPAPAHDGQLYPIQRHNTEEYNSIQENIFLQATKNPLSTFSIDVDAASYSNVRRYLNDGQAPPKDAVRLEEMINYFKYDYPQPQGNDPVSITSELAVCPWNKENKLLQIGLQGRSIATDNLPASNLVFLIDVSGSMSSPDKLPLVKSGFKLLVNQLRPQDNVAIVVYAGAAGLVLPSTPGNQKDKIINAIENLQAGGSTAGGQGIQLAYKIAQESFIKAGNNRVILASDGDFNVGVSSNAELERLIEEKRETGIFLTVLGFGTGNIKDSKMEQLSDKGNGNYAYVDNILEAKKVFVNEFGGTLFTIAKDIKLQLEFNPNQVKAYRLIGYENRALRDEDFNNDKKDAGDLGSGHTVTALYEIIPTKSKNNQPLEEVDNLKYQATPITTNAANSDELVTLKLRYKEPTGNKSKLLQTVITTKETSAQNMSENFRFSAAVAQFGLLLRNSEFKAKASYDSVLELAQNARGKDEEGYRIEFINLVKSSKILHATAQNGK